MAKGQPAVELPRKDLAPQYPAQDGADDAQSFANVEQHTGFETKALTNPKDLGRGEHLRCSQEVGKRGRRLA